MKRQMQLFVVIGLLLAGLTACDKEAVVKDQGKGNVHMTFGFSETPEGRAVQASGKKPTTSWTNNIKDLIVLFVENGTVIDARSVDPLPTGADITDKTVNLKNVPAKNCDIYVVANSGQAAAIARPDWTPENAKGKRVQDLLMQLTAFPDFQTASGLTGNGFNPPAEIFVAKQTVNIKPDDENTIATPFALTRAVSLIRVRLIPKGVNDTKIDFTGNGKSAIYLRRVKTSVTPALVYAPGTVTDVDGVYVNTSFSGTEPTAGYAGTGDILVPAEGIKYYKDFRCFPGGHETAGAEKFDIVIKGTTKDATYVPSGATQPLAANSPVYWSGAISKAITANNILDVVITVSSSGTQDEPEVGSYGNLSIKVNLVEWGNVVLAELPV